MGQPNLSRGIKDLEETLGVKIFKRTSKGIVPTPQGEEFLVYAKKHPRADRGGRGALQAGEEQQAEIQHFRATRELYRGCVHEFCTRSGYDERNRIYL